MFFQAVVFCPILKSLMRLHLGEYEPYEAELKKLARIKPPQRTR
jgi:hypothetical protein